MSAHNFLFLFQENGVPAEGVLLIYMLLLVEGLFLGVFGLHSLA